MADINANIGSAIANAIAGKAYTYTQPDGQYITTNTSGPSITNSTTNAADWTVSTASPGLTTINFNPNYPYMFSNTYISTAVEDVAAKLGFGRVVEGLCGFCMPVGEEAYAAAKKWEECDDSPEEFFVVQTAAGALGIEAALAISEVSLKRLLGRAFYSMDGAPGMTKRFFDVLENTAYLDEYVLSREFAAYWTARLQNTQNSDAKELIRYMLNIVADKKRAA